MGKLFSNLTNSGVMQPNGQTSFQNNPAATGQALALASAATAQPNTSYVDGTLNPDTYTQDDAGGPLTKQSSDNATAINNANAPEAPQPKVVTPSFSAASGGGTTPFSNELTSKGKVLSLLLTAGMGAARGAAASVPTNPHISPGLGPALEAGFQTIPMLKAQQNTLAQQQLEQQKETAQIAALPLQAQTELALKRAQTTWYDNRGEAVGEHNLKAGDTLVDKDGNVIQSGASVSDTAQQKQTGKLAGTVAAVQNAGGTPVQILTALGVKNPTDKNTNTAQMYLDANNGDPGAAIKAMNADHLQLATGIHSAIAALHAPGSGLTAAQQRQLNSDPEFAGLKAQQAALARKLGEMQSDPFADPKAVATAQQSATSLSTRMGAARSRVFGGSASPNTPGPQQPFSHVSSDGKWGWNGVTWVATGR
jgi:hypothetical protein